MRRPSYADVASTLALVLATSAGGAYAAGLVTAEDLAKNAVTSAKIKNGQVKPKDLDPTVADQLKKPGPAGAAGPPGPVGPQGGTGPAGPRGERGVSAWDTIPSGTTVTGDFMDRGHGPSTSYGNYLVHVSYPAPLPAAPKSVTSAPDGNEVTRHDDSTCTGTAVLPTAPPGQVCVYYRDLYGVNVAMAVSDYHRERFGFGVVFNANANTEWGMFGTWAYTAP